MSLVCHPFLLPARPTHAFPPDLGPDGGQVTKAREEGRRFHPLTNAGTQVCQLSGGARHQGEHLQLVVPQGNPGPEHREQRALTKQNQERKIGGGFPSTAGAPGRLWKGMDTALNLPLWGQGQIWSHVHALPLHSTCAHMPHMCVHPPHMHMYPMCTCMHTLHTCMPPAHVHTPAQAGALWSEKAEPSRFRQEPSSSERLGQIRGPSS